MTHPFVKYSSLGNDFLLRISYLNIILLIITGVGESGDKRREHQEQREYVGTDCKQSQIIQEFKKKGKG